MNPCDEDDKDVLVIINGQIQRNILKFDAIL